MDQQLKREERPSTPKRNPWWWIAIAVLTAALVCFVALYAIEKTMKTMLVLRKMKPWTNALEST